MSKRVIDERLELMHQLAIMAHRNNIKNKNKTIKAGCTYVPATVLVDAGDLCGLLDELKRRRASNGRGGTFRLGKTTELLMGMKVGAEVVVDRLPQTTLCAARATARKHMNALDAKWQTRVLPMNKMQITRLPDGASYVHNHNPACAILAKMNIDDVVTLTTITGGWVHVGIKHQARKLAGKSYMRWRFENLANGHVRAIRKA